MHFLIYTEDQPNSSMTATCFYGRDDTLHDKLPSCMKFPAQINHTTVETKEVICGRLSWPFGGSFNTSGSLDETICLKGNPCQLPSKLMPQFHRFHLKHSNHKIKRLKQKKNSKLYNVEATWNIQKLILLLILLERLTYKTIFKYDIINNREE